MPGTVRSSHAITLALLLDVPILEDRASDA